MCHLEYNLVYMPMKKQTGLTHGKLKKGGAIVCIKQRNYKSVTFACGAFLTNRVIFSHEATSIDPYGGTYDRGLTFTLHSKRKKPS